jgi:small subunit ribosomal protein S6
LQGYEIVTIVDPQIADDDVPKTSEKINEFITSRGGSIARVQRWGRRRLAYPIQRQTEAHYLLTTYSLEPEHASELEADLVLAQEILKHMIVKLDEDAFQKASEEPPPVVIDTQPAVAEATAEQVESGGAADEGQAAAVVKEQPAGETEAPPVAVAEEESAAEAEESQKAEAEEPATAVAEESLTEEAEEQPTAEVEEEPAAEADDLPESEKKGEP